MLGSYEATHSSTLDRAISLLTGYGSQVAYAREGKYYILYTSDQNGSIIKQLFHLVRFLLNINSIMLLCGIGVFSGHASNMT